LQTSAEFSGPTSEILRKFTKMAFPADQLGRADFCLSCGHRDALEAGRPLIYSQRSALRSRPRSKEICSQLFRATSAKGAHVTDAYVAALAIESGESITSDRGYARLAGLRWRHPFDER